MPSERGVTRRDLFGRGALSAIGTFAAAWGTTHPEPAPRRVTGERRTVYAALLEAVALAPSVRLSPAAAEQGLDRFERHYAAQPAEARARADAALDALGSGFAAAAPEDRLARLRVATRPVSHEPDPAQAARLALGAHALELAHLGLGGPERDGRVVLTV